MTAQRLGSIGPWDGVPVQATPKTTPAAAAEEPTTRAVGDRRRPLRDLAGHQLQEMDDATKVSLVAYWASVAPAAFLLACEAFEQDTRW